MKDHKEKLYYHLRALRGMSWFQNDYVTPLLMDGVPKDNKIIIINTEMTTLIDGRRTEDEHTHLCTVDIPKRTKLLWACTSLQSRHRMEGAVWNGERMKWIYLILFLQYVSYIDPILNITQYQRDWCIWENHKDVKVQSPRHPYLKVRHCILIIHFMKSLRCSGLWYEKQPGVLGVPYLPTPADIGIYEPVVRITSVRKGEGFVMDTSWSNVMENKNAYI